MCVAALGCLGVLCTLIASEELRRDSNLLIMRTLHFGRTFLRYIRMGFTLVLVIFVDYSRAIDCDQCRSAADIESYTELARPARSMRYRHTRYTRYEWVSYHIANAAARCGFYRIYCSSYTKLRIEVRFRETLRTISYLDDFTDVCLQCDINYLSCAPKNKIRTAA